MSRNGSGVYAVPNTFVAGTPITASDHNENWDDIAAEITNSMALDGQSAMTGQLKLANGTVSVPACAFGSDADTGRYRKSANTMADVCAGAEVLEISTTGLAVTGALSVTGTLNAVGGIQIGGGPVWSTGDVKLTLKTTADAGWVLANDGTIGDASSGATLASATTSDLFALIWLVASNTSAPIFDSAGVASTRGATAAADYAAHKRLSLTKMLGRALAVAGSGSGLTSRAVGESVGAETVPIGQVNIPSYTLSHTLGLSGTASVTFGPGNVYGGMTGNANDSTGGATPLSNTLRSANLDPLTGTISFSGASFTGSVTSGGSGTALAINDPKTFINAMIKL